MEQFEIAVFEIISLEADDVITQSVITDPIQP